jgi:hypothetical protein
MSIAAAPALTMATFLYTFMLPSLLVDKHLTNILNRPLWNWLHAFPLHGVKTLSMALIMLSSAMAVIPITMMQVMVKGVFNSVPDR